MKILKKGKKGFTLTELIIVIVIIGILAAVLIPSLTGYVKKSKMSAAEQEAAAIYAVYHNYDTEVKAGNFTTGDKPFATYYKEITSKDLLVSSNGSNGWDQNPSTATVEGKSYQYAFRYISADGYIVYMNATGNVLVTVEEK